jgi:hypothetical protein
VPAEHAAGGRRKLHDVLVEATKGAAMQQLLRVDRNRPVHDDAGRARKFQAAESEKWKSVIKKAGIEPEVSAATGHARHVEAGRRRGLRRRSLDAPIDLAERGALDYLVLECLAERTIALAQLRRRRDPATDTMRGSASAIESLLPILARRGYACSAISARRIRSPPPRRSSRSRKRLRIPVKVPAVTGDDVLDALDLDAPTMESGVPLSHYAPLVSANAYLGAEAMLPALASGADIVVTAVSPIHRCSSRR